MLTPAERRGASLVALLLALGAGDELWRAAHPRPAPAPRGLGSSPGESASNSSPFEGASGRSTPAGGRPISASGDSTGVASGVSGRTTASDDVVVDLNRADAAQLDRLPGIGPVLARRIIDYRARHGRFSRCEELLGVPGIGPRLLERVRPHVTL